MTDQPEGRHRHFDPGALSGRQRYELLTSLVVPRPIGWISTWRPDGGANLAPFSFFQALSGTPMLVCVAIGQRAGAPKDSLVNIRARRQFCVNVVSEHLLEAMNQTSAEVGPTVDEFELAGLAMGRSTRVDAPLVQDCLAVLECEARQEVELRGATYTLLIAEVVGVLLDERLELHEGTHRVRAETLRPVGRLSGPEYMLFGGVKVLPRPS